MSINKPNKFKRFDEVIYRKRVGWSPGYEDREGYVLHARGNGTVDIRLFRLWTWAFTPACPIHRTADEFEAGLTSKDKPLGSLLCKCSRRRPAQKRVTVCIKRLRHAGEMK